MRKEPRLVAPGNGRANYAVEYWSPEKGFTTRQSLGTPDREAAEQAFAQWKLKFYWDREQRANEQILSLAARIVSGQGQDKLAQTTVQEILALAYTEYFQKLPSRYVYKSALAYVNEYLDGVTMGEFKRKRQEKFIEELREAGLSDGTISRIMAAVSTAIGRAYHNEEREKPFIISLTVSNPRQGYFTDEEARQVIQSAQTEAAKRFVMLAFLTAARPQAIIELTPQQFDFQKELLDLNPPGRKQNAKKYRPTIPMGKYLSTTCKNWLTGPIFVVEKNQKEGKTVRRLTTYRPISESLSYPEGKTLYTIRHSIATEMRTQGVPEMDIAAFLGHRPPGVSAVTLGYAKFRPEYLSRAREAVDAYWERLNGQPKAQDDGGATGMDGKGLPSGG